MDIGATMGERLIFHSSLGFVILLSYGIMRLIEKRQNKVRSAVLMGLCSILTIACGYETINRNAQWKSDITLSTHDVHYGTNSIILNGNAGTCYITLADMNKDTALLDTAIRYLRKSIVLHKGNIYPDSYMNMGVAYFQLRIPDSAMLYWGILKENIPVYPGLAVDDSLLAAAFLDKGVKLGQQKNNLPAAIREIKKAIMVRPDKAEFWYNLGGAYFTEQNYDSAHYAWEKTLELNPNYTLAKQGLSNLKLANPK
jgi:tetratricopeptide (TPR) repeat protein